MKNLVCIYFRVHLRIIDWVLQALVLYSTFPLRTFSSFLSLTFPLVHLMVTPDLCLLFVAAASCCISGWRHCIVFRVVLNMTYFF